MDLSPEIALSAGTVIASAGIAFGIVKGRLYNYMTYDRHREICESERKKTTDSLDKLFDLNRETLGMIKEIHGYLKAKNGGGL